MKFSYTEAGWGNDAITANAQWCITGGSVSSQRPAEDSLDEEAAEHGNELRPVL